MQKKVGILTFHRAINYGALLQAYALNRYLQKEVGIDNEIIDYRCPLIEKSCNPIIISKNPIKNIIRLLISSPILFLKKRRFRNFLKKYIKTSHPYFDKSELEKIESQYSYFITGSDQVFSPIWTDFDPVYFLDFTSESEKKYSYAASFGTDQLPNQLFEAYKLRLESFNKISVREKSAQILLNQKFNIKSEMHIDPTFLLTKEEWSEICHKPFKEKYIIVYLLGKDQSVSALISFAKDLAKKKNLKIIYLNDRYYEFKRGINYRPGVSPSKFISFIKNSEYIITNSFHGTAFSIIFNKEFFVNSQLIKGSGTRIQNILNICEIRNRDIGEEKYIDKKIEIDWTTVNSIICKERQKSYEYFAQIFGVN